jgi:hypothetical protein
MTMRSTLGAAGAAAIFALAAPQVAGAQQFVADDAAIGDRGSCQLEAWHGEFASWIIPACHFVPNLELSLGVGFVGHGPDARDTEFLVEGKYLFREMAPNRPGIGLVAGFEVDPRASTGRDRFEGVYAYVPVSFGFNEDRLVLHGNLGWHFERDDHGHGHGDEDAHHALTWAVRADVLLPVAAERFTLIGELFGEDRLLPEFQLGVRAALIPDRLLVDLSWGGHTQSDMRGAGWTLGAAWTPPAFR